MRHQSPTTTAKADGCRRLEGRTGGGRRWRWTAEEKAWIVAESLDPATTAAAVARRYGLPASPLVAWRQQFAAPAAGAAPAFVPVVVAEGAATPPERAGRMEIALGPVVVRVGADVDAAAGARGGAGPAVIAVPPGVRILLAAQPVDFRKGMDGLAALVQQALRADPFAGDVFIFRPKRADRVKILVYDGTGLVLYSKRLEAGRFTWPAPADGVVRLSAAQLATLLEGLPWHHLQPRPVRRPSTAW
jgi:transposase